MIKGKRVNRGGGYRLEVPCEYPFEGDRFSCSLLQAKLIEVEFHVRCGGPWKAYIYAQTKPLSLLILVFKYIMLYLMSCWKKLDMVHVSSYQKILKYSIVIDYVTIQFLNDDRVRLTEETA